MDQNAFYVLIHKNIRWYYVKKYPIWGIFNNIKNRATRNFIDFVPCGATSNLRKDLLGTKIKNE
mgnify:CR=1 FL=1